MHLHLLFETPLWTGGLSHVPSPSKGPVMNRVRTTGLLGSLRWWYEAVVRALGGWACDPTQHTCLLDRQRFREMQAAPRHQRLRAAGLCDVCRDFGATGWRRAFDLIAPPTMRPARNVPRQIQARDPACGDRRPRWYLPGPGHQGTLVLHLRPRGSEAHAPLERLALVLHIVARHAALGAKTGLGYGRFRLESPPPPDAPAVLRAWQETLAPPPEDISQAHLPDLTRMFFAHLEVPPSSSPWQAVADLKCRLRRAFRAGFSPALRHFLMGEVRGGHRIAARIRMTAVYNGTMRVWGWVPDTVARFAPEGQKAEFREQIMQRLYDEIRAFGRLRAWREFNAERDTQGRISAPVDFVHSLLTA